MSSPIRTLGDYSKPSHEGYRNTIKLPAGNNVVPLRSDTIRLVQNGCSFHELRSEDPNQHLKDFIKLVRINQKSQENSQKQAITDTRIRRVQKEAKEQKPEAKPQSNPVNHWSTKVNKIHNIPF
ncbi:hypothetical protein Tco_0897631 [Tanacetum coccineum]